MTEYTHYRLLEIQSTATLGEIKQAYRRLAKLFHPDLQSSITDPEKIVRLNAAYEVLSDPQRRRVYDAELREKAFPHQRERRRSKAQQQHQETRQTTRSVEWEVQIWMHEVYTPIQRLLLQIIKPLNQQIDELAADPFDDSLMEDFLAYLDHSQALLAVAHRLFSSRPNPSQVAQSAASLYYCLNHLGDGLEDFSLFTLGYDDHHLHTGQELWRLAQQQLKESQQQLNVL